MFANLDTIWRDTDDFLSLSEHMIRKLAVTPVVCLKLGRPNRKSALCSVRKFSLLLTVRVVTLASLAISERFFRGSFLKDQTILQSVSDNLRLQGGKEEAQSYSFVPQIVRMSLIFLDRALPSSAYRRR